ncbi:MAG: 5'/3'-nucleotidase SurE [bacterium]
MLKNSTTTRRPFILITGDDSVRSEGIILLKRVTEGFADVEIVATKDQCTGVGAAMTHKGGAWGKEVVDGKEMIWVEGMPVDAVHFAMKYFKRKPDLVLSGVNTGLNVQNNTTIRSGTVGAAHAAAAWMKVPTVALSLDVKDLSSWFKEHDGQFNEDLLEYPGKMIRKIVDLALHYQFPVNGFWNVNFPHTATDKIRVTSFDNNIAYPNEVSINGDHYHYLLQQLQLDYAQDTDIGTVFAGIVSITPCLVNFFDASEKEKLVKAVKNSNLLRETV